MLKLRKIHKRLLGIVLTLCIIFCLLIFVFGEPSKYSDNKIKLQIIEENINSSNNQGICKVPFLPLNSTELSPFLKKVSPILCNPNIDWIECIDSVCKLRDIVINVYGTIKCKFRDIIRRNDNDFYFDNIVTIIGKEVYKLEKSDFVNVFCKVLHSKTFWSKTIIGIRDDPQIINRINTHIKINENEKNNKIIDNDNVNVLMFGFDSLSRNAFIRSLPKSYDYIINKLHGDVLNGYNIVGDGTPQALIPLLTGYTELELPETRRRMPESNFVDVYPMIWNDYKKAGYVTAFNEDVPHIGTFSYRLNGFNKQPTDHYMRTFYQAINTEKENNKLCYKNKPKHQLMLDYIKDFFIKYKNVKKFLFGFHGELSHDSINLIGAADDDLYNWLKDLYAFNIFNNSIVIIMSDHGNRFAEIRNTKQGKLEERLPFFSFIFPEWFKIKYKHIYKNFLENKNRLTTPFDVHATLEDILKLKTLNKVLKTKSRAISLFHKISNTRSCSDAYIEPHWCACLNWITINISDVHNDRIKYKAADAIVNLINNFTHSNHECETLKLYKVDWLGKLLPNYELINFKRNLDIDGFLGEFSKNVIIHEELYQIKLTLVPGLSIFEASLAYNMKTDNFTVKLSDVSRINKYGDQARCIYDSNPELRKYCYCRDE